MSSQKSSLGGNLKLERGGVGRGGVVSLKGVLPLSPYAVIKRGWNDPRPRAFGRGVGDYSLG